MRSQGRYWETGIFSENSLQRLRVSWKRAVNMLNPINMNIQSQLLYQHDPIRKYLLKLPFSFLLFFSSQDVIHQIFRLTSLSLTYSLMLALVLILAFIATFDFDFGVVAFHAGIGFCEALSADSFCFPFGPLLWLCLKI